MMDENLIGYALNALDADDHRRTEEYLRDHPEAKRKLGLIQKALKPLATDREPMNPPADLVDRTMSRVSEVFVRRRKIGVASRESAFFAPNRWRRMDVFVACSILILIGGLGTSGLVRIKQNQYRLGCQDSLRKYHEALTTYSSLNNGALPVVSEKPPYNRAGAFVQALKDSGQIPADAKIDCPTAPTNVANVTYAYHLPYRDADNKLHGLFRGPGKGDPGTLPIMADLPLTRAHGQGFNVLYNDGNVRYVTDPNVGIDGDDIFVNALGKIAPGLGLKDSVLAPPDFGP